MACFALLCLLLSLALTPIAAERAQAAARDVPVDALLATFQTKIDQVLAVGDPLSYPSSTQQSSHGHAKFVWSYSSGWTSGFFPGMLWMMANHTGNATLAQIAAAYTQGRAVEANDTSTHDVGFVVFLSFGLGATMGGRQDAYLPVLLQAASSLAKRYNDIVGMTRSWGSISDMKSFEVIIDNLLNLELLLWGAQHGGDPQWMDMSISHATKTAQWWIRPDNSTFHLVVFDPKSGAVISRSGTPQGYSVTSTWARGQAWGIYGFTMIYRYTRLDYYLDVAEQLVEYYAQHVGPDYVPLWDFDAPPDQPYKDTSCAAIVASGLLELDVYRPGRGHAALAQSILASLASSYLGGALTDAVLVQNHHDCGSDLCTVIETDYYFLEALLRLKARA